jgi:hypothetical protein
MTSHLAGICGCAHGSWTGPFLSQGTARRRAARPRLPGKVDRAMAPPASYQALEARKVDHDHPAPARPFPRLQLQAVEKSLHPEDRRSAGMPLPRWPTTVDDAMTMHLLAGASGCDKAKEPFHPEDRGTADMLAAMAADHGSRGDDVPPARRGHRLHIQGVEGALHPEDRVAADMRGSHGGRPGLTRT